MLVLTRKCQQQVVVEGYGGSTPMLTVTVLEIRGGRVKLGFDVATDVPVDRRDVWEYFNDHDGDDRPTKRSAERNGKRNNGRLKAATQNSVHESGVMP